jgi:hypothetical protein
MEYAKPYLVSLGYAAGLRRHATLHAVCLWLAAVDRQVTPNLLCFRFSFWSPEIHTILFGDC